MAYSSVSRVDGGDSFLYMPKCNGGDNFSTIRNSGIKNVQKLNDLIEKLDNEKNYIFEIDFVGKIETSLTPLFGHLSWSRAEMQIIDVIAVKDITSALKSSQKPNYEFETPITDKGEALKTINTEIMFYFMSGKIKYDFPEIESYISDTFQLVNKQGKTFNKDNLTDFFEESLFDNKEATKSVFVQNPIVQFKNNCYFASGKMGNNHGKENSEVINYLNTYVYNKDSWQLIETKFFKNQVSDR